MATGQWGRSVGTDSGDVRVVKELVVLDLQCVEYSANKWSGANYNREADCKLHDHVLPRDETE